MKRGKYFYIETFGCQMNEFDSERICYSMQNDGYIKTDKINKADFVILNTCSVRKKAVDRLYGHIGALKKLKAKRPEIIICVGGCTAQELKNKIIDDFQFVDIVFGTKNQDRVSALIEEKIKLKRSICDTDESFLPAEHLYDFDRKYSFKAFLPVMTGCDNFCSYCIVPYVRGRERSIPPEMVIRTVKKLIGNGVVEVMLLGQNVNSYGNDLKIAVKDRGENNRSGNKNQFTFAELLNEIVSIDGLKRLRFMTSHPKDFNDDLIKTISKNANIMKHIHLPVQAGSDKILGLMNRKYTRQYYTELYRKIKNHIPECAISTDIIVGFPQEQYEDFQQTLELVRMLRFNRAFTFIYSGRNGTAAEKIEDTVKLSEKKKWFNELVEVQKEISYEENIKLVGKSLDVLVEGKCKEKGDFLEGRLENNNVVNFTGNTELIGKIIGIKITEAKSFYLNGILPV